MTAIEQAIKEAKEKGGYTEIWFFGYGEDPSPILLDPAFWQALGKAWGWSEYEYSVSFGSQHPTLAMRFGGRAYTLDTWRYHWHRFIDHLAEGKDAESYFASLQ